MVDQQLSVDEWKAQRAASRRVLLERVRVPGARLTSEEYDELEHLHLLRRIETLEHELSALKRDLSYER